MDEDHFLDGMSPPSSANDSDNNLPSLSAAAAAVAQSFAARFPPYEYANHVDDDEDMDGEHEIDEDMLRGHTETVSTPRIPYSQHCLTFARRLRMRIIRTHTATTTTSTTLLSPMCTTTLSPLHTTATTSPPLASASRRPSPSPSASAKARWTRSPRHQARRPSPRVGTS